MRVRVRSFCEMNPESVEHCENERVRNGSGLAVVVDGPVLVSSWWDPVLFVKFNEVGRNGLKMRVDPEFDREASFHFF